MHSNVAERLTARARDCGLSHGAYLTTLIDGVPAPSLAMVDALRASTNRITDVAATVDAFFARIRDEAAPADASLVRQAVEDTREHLKVASRVVAELRPGRKRSKRPASHRGVGRRSDE